MRTDFRRMTPGRENVAANPRPHTGVGCLRLLVAVLLTFAPPAFGQVANTVRPTGDSHWGLLNFLVFIVLPLCACIHAVRSASGNRLVFYHNQYDLLLSTMAPWVGFSLGWCAGERAQQWILWGVVLGTPLWNLVAGFWFNPGKIGGALCIGLSRTVIGVIVPLVLLFGVLFGVLLSGRKDEASALNYHIRKIEAVAFVAGLAWVFWRLINGEKVATARNNEDVRTEI